MIRGIKKEGKEAPIQFTFYHLQRLKKGQLTRITFWNDYFRPHFDIVPVTMYQQGRCNAERSLLLFVEQHRPPAGALEPHHPRQRESIEELAQGHVAAAGAGTTLGRRLPRARQRLGQRGHLLARHRRKLAVRRHLCDNLDSPPPGKRRFFRPYIKYPTFQILYCASFQIGNNSFDNPRFKGSPRIDEMLANVSSQL